MINHTSGPWHLAGGCQIRSEKDQIAKCWMMRNGEGKSNANLIAAAPELLEALLRLRAAFVVLAGEKSPFSKAALELPDAAILKARGDK